VADWYCGSVQHAAIAQYANSHAYSVGDIVRALASPSSGNERAFRCTTAGTSGGSEPSWTLTKGGTTNAGTAVFTEVTGNSTYGWSAAAALIQTMVGFAAAGDRIFVADDHASSSASAGLSGILASNAPSGPLTILCVDHTGSTPPVSADLRTTATITATGSSDLVLRGSAYVYGITAINSGTGNIRCGETGGAYVAVNCKMRLTNAAAQQLRVGAPSANQPVNTLWDGTTVEFGNSGSGIYQLGGGFRWQNTASAIVSGTLPTTLFPGSTIEGSGRTVFDGVDLSALGSGKTIMGANGGSNVTQLENCRIGASVTVAATPTQHGNRVEVINCDSGATGYRNEIYDYSGTLTVETTIIRTAGASDGVQAVSWKIVTTANCSRVFPFRSWPIPLWNTATGGAKTATVEMVNDGVTLKDSEAALEVAYLGSSSYPLASRVTTAAADLLNAGASIATSTETWTTTGLSSPVKQKMAAAFTPNMVGQVRGTIVISKASQTLYADYKISPLT
jgi:hypothetical protein